MAFLKVSYENRYFWREFINLYHNFPIVWSKVDDDKQKHTKHFRNRALNILLRKYRELQPAATVSTLKEALKALHSSYRKELRMVIEQEFATMNDSTVYKSPWWCFEELDFLRSQEEKALKLIELRIDKFELKEKDNPCASFESYHMPEDNFLENITDHEDEVDVYCKHLAETMKKMSEDQLNHARYHIGIVMDLGIMGLLSRNWPGNVANVSVNVCKCSTPSSTTQSESSIRAAKGKVQLSKRSASNEYGPEKRMKYSMARNESEFEHLQADFKERANMSKEKITAEDMVFEALEDVNFDIPSGSETQSITTEIIDIGTKNVEISVIDLHEVPDDSDEQNLDSSETMATHDTNFVSVRLPSGPTLRRQCRMHSSKYVNNIVPGYNDEEFLRQFRIGRNIVQMLCQHMETTDQYRNLNGHGGYEAVSAQTHVLAFLWFLGHDKTSYRYVADLFELSVSCLHDIIWRVCDSILGMGEDIIVRPDDEKKKKSSSYFSKKCTISGVIGCVDGTQIKIDKPFENSERYLIRKGYYSIQLQAIINEEMHFVDVFVEYPGEPEMLTGVKNLCDDRYFLVGGIGYPCLPQVLVPYRSDEILLSKAQESFNKQLRNAWRSNDKVFLHLKQRFRQLYHLKVRQLSRIVKLIKVCCILHNLTDPAEIALLEKETNDLQEESCVAAPVFTYTSGNQSESEVAVGQQQRDAICANFNLILR